MAGPVDVDSAVRAAQDALQVWSTWKPADRGRVLHRLGELMERDRDELARLSVLDNGMTATMSPLLVDLMTSWTSYYAGWADKIEGRVTSSPSQQRELGYTMPEPYGVVGIILTWNGPLVSVGMKLIPALAAGNTVVMKPSELTPYATEHLMTLIREAGIPPGVVNLLLGGPEAGDALVRHELVKKVTFTGGPATARKILATCAESLKPAVLELGGKSANVIFPDADLDLALAINVFAVFGTLAGQGCAIATRMIVHDDIYDEVAERTQAVVRTLRCGDPFDPEVIVGPVVTRAAQKRILDMIEKAQAQGAKLLAGGSVPQGLNEGFFVEPTVLGDVDPASELGQVEVFGPVLSLMRFHDEDEAVKIANATEYGLAAYLFTNDAGASIDWCRASRLAASTSMARHRLLGASSPSAVSASLATAGRAARKGCMNSSRRRRLLSHDSAHEPQRHRRCADRRRKRNRTCNCAVVCQRGAKVAVSDVDGDRAEETASLVGEAGGEAIALAVDVSRREDLEELREMAFERFGRLDVVMNNVGVIAMGAPESLPFEAWERVVDLNLMSVVRSNLVFLPHLIAQGSGHVINTASASGLLAYGFDRLPYVSTKHAVVGLSEALALYLGPKGVGVTCVCPSGVITNILEQITVYGEATSPRAPQHALADPADVGELIAEGVANGSFLVVTADEIYDELRERAADPEAYIQRMIKEQLSD